MMKTWREIKIVVCDGEQEVHIRNNPERNGIIIYMAETDDNRIKFDLELSDQEANYFAREIIKFIAEERHSDDYMNMQ